MRRILSLLQRMILTLALIVAAMPVKASESDCAPARPKCAMPCCAAKSVARMACPTPTQVAPAHVVKKAACPCDLRPGPAIAPIPAKAVAPTFQDHALAPPAVILPMAKASSQVEPGVFGADSGPPPAPPHRSDSSRAPPVVRA